MTRSEGVKKWGNTWSVMSNEISLSTTAYAAGDLMGGLLTFNDVLETDIGGGTIVGAEIIDTSTVVAAIDLIVFQNALSTGTSATGDNAAFDLSDTDMVKVSDVISFSTGYLKQYADNALHMVASELDSPFYLSGGNDLYGVLVSQATPTYTTGNSLSVRLDIRRDAD